MVFRHSKCLLFKQTLRLGIEKALILLKNEHF